MVAWRPYHGPALTKPLPAALPHGTIDEVFPDIFRVRGSMRFGPGLSIPRNMTIVRTGSELVLINSVRLSPEGEAALEALGTVRHLVRLGAFHGLDDPWYRQRYTPTYWAPLGLDADRTLTSGEAPVGDVFRFEAAKKPEAAMLLPGGVLVTCDSFQNWTAATFGDCSFGGRLMMRAFGFRPTLIGPFWLKEAGRGVEADFRRLAELPFESVISGHGEPLRGDGREGLRGEIARTFAR